MLTIVFAISTFLTFCTNAQAYQAPSRFSSRQFVQPANSVGSQLYYSDEPRSTARCFRLRNHGIYPSDVSGPIKPDVGVTRTWFFQETFPCGRFGNESWCQTEHDARELKDYFYRPVWEITGDVLSDNEFLYSRESMFRLGGALAIAAAFANTSIDEDFQDWLQRQGATHPNADCGFSDLGDGNYVIPTTAAIYVISRGWQARHPSTCNPIAETLETWSYRSGRSMLVGAPVLLSVQWITGASRPGESSAGSKWKPFDDTNGASGHTYIGAIPFLVGAKMARRPIVKAACYFGSGLAGYGRLCDNGHYLSQVMLGWSIAFLSVEATTRTDLSAEKYRLVPMNLHGFYGLGIEIRR